MTEDIILNIPDTFLGMRPLFKDDKDWEGACYVLDRIRDGILSEKDEQFNGYVCLSSQIMRDILHNGRFERVKSILIDNGVIRCDGECKPDVKCYGYMFLGQHAAAPSVPVTVSSLCLRRRIHGCFRRKNNGTTLKTQAMMRRDITIDGEEFVRIMETDPPKDRHTAMELRKDIDGGKYMGNLCDYGRFHSPFTRLPRQLRSALRIRGKRTVMLDIKNSQPLMLFILARSIASAKNYSVPFILKHGTFSGIRRLTRPSGATYGELPKDVIQYGDDCQQGVLYAKLFEAKYPDLTFSELSREETTEAKEEMFAQLFFWEKVDLSGWREVFNRFYPKVYDVLCRLKWGRKQGYGFASQTLQRIESDIIICRVVPELLLLKISFYTIHDAVCVAEEDVQTAMNTIMSAFADVGIEPRVKTEHL